MRRLCSHLTFWVLSAIVVGALIGHFAPAAGVSLKIVADSFVNLVKIFVGPIIFLTVTLGLAGMDNLKKVGRVGVKALIYFEVVTTLALLIGIVVAHFVQPGAGLDASHLASGPAPDVARYQKGATELSAWGFFRTNFTLQVLVAALIFGSLLHWTPRRVAIVVRLEQIAHWVFRGLRWVMYLAPLGALGGMAFTVGKYGIASLLPLGKLMLAVYGTMAVFIVGVLGPILRWCGIGLWRYLTEIREEILIVLGTSSSEAALPQLMAKLERMGCPRSLVGLVIPSGYSFNLDGTTIYLSMAVMFLTQVFRVDLSLSQIGLLIGVLMVTSKGAAGVTGSGFIVLASTLMSLKLVPIEGLALLLGVDRFMSEARAITNLIGNGVATLALSHHEGELHPAPIRSEGPAGPAPRSNASTEP